jgi:hypothetical protein
MERATHGISLRSFRISVQSVCPWGRREILPGFCPSFRAESAGRFLLYGFFLIIHGDFLYYIPFRRISSRYPAMNLCSGEGLFPLPPLLSAPAPATTCGQVFVLPFKAWRLPLLLR